MNPTAVLALIGDLYAQIDALQQENEALKKPEPEDREPSFDPLAGPEGAITQARKESEG